MKLATMLFALAASVSANVTAAGNTSSTTYGQLPKEGTASRVIKVTPRTRVINVHDGETVRINLNGKVFEWTVNIPAREGVINLSDITPTETSVGSVRVYVSPNPLYLN